MSNKDKIIGLVIMVVGLLIMVGYILWGPVDLYYERVLDKEFLPGVWGLNWRYAVIVPLTLIVVLIGLLAAWIGYSMLTTPPPVPLEELEAELEAEEAASKAGSEE